MIKTTVYGLVISTTCILGALMPAFITFILKLQKKFTPKEKLLDENLVRPLLEENIVQVNQKVNLIN